MTKIFALPLWQKILIGMALGLAVGFIFKEDAAHLKPLGDLFIRLIKMLVVPLVFFTLISGVASLGDPKALGRMGAKALALYVITAAIAISIGIFFAETFRPGEGIELNLATTQVAEAAPEARGVVDTILEMVPTNPLKAMVEGNMLQIIVLSLLFGVSVSLTKSRPGPFIDICDSAAEVCFTLTMVIMKLAPLGVFGLMAWVAGTQDPAVLLSLGKVLLVFLAAVTVHVIVVFGGTLYALRLNPLVFANRIKEALIMAFTTSSSSASLPVTMEAVEHKLRVSDVTCGFTLPLGATVNMNGSALYQGVCAVFIAQAVGMDLAMEHYFAITATSILAAVGTAGIPGAGLLMLTLVLSSVGLPTEGIAIILGIDRIMDMVRTVVNVAGDAFVALLIDLSENRYDRAAFVA